MFESKHRAWVTSHWVSVHGGYVKGVMSCATIENYLFKVWPLSPLPLQIAAPNALPRRTLFYLCSQVELSPFMTELRWILRRLHLQVVNNLVQTGSKHSSHKWPEVYWAHQQSSPKEFSKFYTTINSCYMQEG